MVAPHTYTATSSPDSKLETKKHGANCFLNSLMKGMIPKDKNATKSTVSSRRKDEVTPNNGLSTIGPIEQPDNCEKLTYEQFHILHVLIEGQTKEQHLNSQRDGPTTKSTKTPKDADWNQQDKQSRIEELRTTLTQECEVLMLELDELMWGKHQI
eukprot:Filipodium_phascolosomae@DN4051_c0_g1_i1.p1